MTNALDKAFADRIRREYREYRKDEDLGHNRDLHKRIIRAWKQDSPKFWMRLRKAKLLHQTAFVMQVRMWREEDRLMSAGYAYTDAREQAERTCLMMEPEDGGWGELDDVDRVRQKFLAGDELSFPEWRLLKGLPVEDEETEA